MKKNGSKEKRESTQKRLKERKLSLLQIERANQKKLGKKGME